MKILVEKIGDSPEWMEIQDYRYKGRKAELMLGLGESYKRKTYWFPLTPVVYQRFRDKIQESRSTGLNYLQRYIRMYRGYAGIWPHKGYVHYNKLSERSFMEAFNASPTSTIIGMFDEGIDYEVIAAATHLSESTIKSVLAAYAKYPSMVKV